MTLRDWEQLDADVHLLSRLTIRKDYRKLCAQLSQCDYNLLMPSGESSYWRHLNNYLVWGTAQLCYHTTSVIIYSDCTWVEMEGLMTLYTNRQYLLPCWYWKIAWKEAEKANCHLLCLPLENMVTVRGGSANRLFQEKNFVDLVRNYFILVSTLDKSKKLQSKIQQSQHMLLLIVFNDIIADVSRNNRHWSEFLQVISLTMEVVNVFRLLLKSASSWVEWWYARMIQGHPAQEIRRSLDY